LSFFRIALKNILRRKLRTALTLCGVGMGIAAFVALVGFSRAFENEWLKIYDSAGTEITVVQKTFLNTSVDESVGETLKTLPVVERVVPMVLNMMDITPDVNAIVYGFPADSYELDSLVITGGRRFHGTQPEIMLGEVMAETLHKKPGDTLEIQGTPFQVVGVFHGGSALETGGVLMPMAQLQKLADLGNKVTAFHIRLKPAPGLSPDERIRNARKVIEAALPNLKAVPASERAGNNQLVVLARSTAWGTSLIALFIGALGITNTMAMSVFERTKEIGVLRALGWKRHRIMKLILTEAAALGLVGGLCGLVLGWLALQILARIPQTAGIGFASIRLDQAAETLVIAIMIGVLAGFVPAWRGAQLSPVEALRYE
jgi:putative ABC transport system permease protein